MHPPAGEFVRREEDGILVDEGVGAPSAGVREDGVHVHAGVRGGAGVVPAGQGTLAVQQLRDAVHVAQHPGHVAPGGEGPDPALRAGDGMRRRTPCQ
eukprot:8384104-Pyramimonas_sp.AAC.1